MKLFFLILAIFLVWRILRAMRNNRTASTGARVKDMRPCEYCGLHVPEDEAVTRHGKYYCSEEHARKEEQ